MSPRCARCPPSSTSSSTSSPAPPATPRWRSCAPCCRHRRPRSVPRPMLDVDAGRRVERRAPAGGDGAGRARPAAPAGSRDADRRSRNASLGHAAAYLHAVTGAVPDPRPMPRALEQYLILTIDHGFNASTFTGRVVASTGASIVDVVCAAIGALAGPLHGGAPSRALDALDAIGSPERAADWVRGEVVAGRRIMGFGHAVYRAPDPRSSLLREVAARARWRAGRAGDGDRGRDPGDAGRAQARSSAAEQRRVLRRRDHGDRRPAARRCSRRRSPSAARSAGAPTPSNRRRPPS